MEIKLNHCKLAVCFFFSTFVLLQTTAYAVANPGLVNQLEVEPNGFDMQISEVGCLRLLEKIDIDEDLREKAIEVLMSPSTFVRKRALLLCSAYYDDRKLFVQRLRKLLLMDEAMSVNSDTQSLKDSNEKSLFPVWYRNSEGKAVFKAIPVIRTWWVWNSQEFVTFDVGEYVDLNGDGLVDFAVSFIDRADRDAYYRADFINIGNGFVMDSCVATGSWTALPPCQ